MVNKTQLFYGVLLLFLSLAVFIDAKDFGLMTTLVGIFFSICGLALVINSKYKVIK